MTSNEAYTYTPTPKKKKKSLWDKIIYGIGDSNPKWKKPIKLFSKGGKVK